MQPAPNTSPTMANPRMVGAFVQSPNPEAPEIIGYNGYDFSLIDMEHGTIGFDTAVNLIRSSQAANLRAMVRIPNPDTVVAEKVLDAGATGVLIPRAKTRADLEPTVNATKFSANRGACPLTRSAKHFTWDWDAYRASADKETVVWALIETPEAVENIDDILELSGLDGIVIGPFDLAHAMGHSGDREHPDVEAAIKRVITKAREKSKDAIAVAFSANPQDAKEEMEKWVSAGCTIVVTASDRSVLANGFASYKSVIEEMRAGK